jgi:hypothetical protein
MSPKSYAILMNLISEYRLNRDKIKPLVKSQEAIKEQIDTLSTSLNVVKIDNEIVLISKSTSRINPAKLLERGVSLEDLEWATETVDSSYYKIL